MSSGDKTFRACPWLSNATPHLALPPRRKPTSPPEASGARPSRRHLEPRPCPPLHTELAAAEPSADASAHPSPHVRSTRTQKRNLDGTVSVPAWKAPVVNTPVNVRMYSHQLLPAAVVASWAPPEVLRRQMPLQFCFLSHLQGAVPPSLPTPHQGGADSLRTGSSQIEAAAQRRATQTSQVGKTKVSIIRGCKSWRLLHASPWLSCARR